jgi:predicted nucleotidyltransferase
MNIKNIQNLAIPVLKKYRIAKASLFGSAVRGEMNALSDIDMLVELPDDVHGFEYVDLKVGLQEELESTLGKSVDLVEFKLIKDSLKNYILPEQVRIL